MAVAPRAPEREGAAQGISPREGHGAGRGFGRMDGNEATASAQWYVPAAFKNVRDLNKSKAGGDRARWPAIQSCRRRHVANPTARGAANACSVTARGRHALALWFEGVILGGKEAICTKKGELLFHVPQPSLGVSYKSGCCCFARSLTSASLPLCISASLPLCISADDLSHAAVTHKHF